MGKEDNHHRIQQRIAAVGSVAILSLLTLILGTSLLGQAQRATAWFLSDATTAPESTTLLAVYVLAFDNANNENNTLNLTYKYTDTVQGIVAATDGYPDVTAVILADLDQMGDTHILLVENGTITTVTGLPDEFGIIAPTATEYNTADGDTLGGFLLWVRQQYTAPKKIFSYIGHGTPLGPVTEPSIAEIITAARSTTTVRLPNAIPMPLTVDANPDFTDQHDPDSAFVQMVTPYDLALALEKGTNNGADQFDVLDLVHCFAASIDELYELAPYGHRTVATPNYTYFDPPMIGLALAELAVDLTMTSGEMANSILAKYFDVLPPGQHPQVIVAVDNSLLAAVKQNWDLTAAALMTEFAQDPNSTSTRIINAYHNADVNGSYYDTTFCSQVPDYDLGAPDALTDMGSFALALKSQFPQLSPVHIHAQATYSSLSSAIVTKANQNGSPWWDPTPSHWDFNSVLGVGLFTPFVPMTFSNTQFHSWQSLWYTHTTVIATDVEIGGQLVEVLNPHPYAFIASTSSGATWADVVEAVWVQEQIHPGGDVTTALCLPEFKELEEPDLKVIVTDSTNDVWPTHDLTYSVRVINKTSLPIPDVILTDTLPSGVTWISTTPSALCTHNAGIINCNLGDLLSHETYTVTIHTNVDLNTVGQVSNLARVSTSAPEYRLYDNSNVETTNVRYAWQLGIQGQITSTQINEGELTLYTAVLQNSGVATTTASTIISEFPAELAIAGPVTIDPPHLGVPGSGATLAHIPALAPGQTVRIAVPVIPNDGPATLAAGVSATSTEVALPVSSSVLLTVNNLAPVAVADVYATSQGKTLHVNAPGVLGNDVDVIYDTLTTILISPPTRGHITLSTDGAFTYIPFTELTGIDTFTYSVLDSDGAQSETTVTILVRQKVFLPVVWTQP